MQVWKSTWRSVCVALNHPATAYPLRSKVSSICPNRQTIFVHFCLWLVCTLGGFLLLVANTNTHAATHWATPADYREILGKLRPGDTLVLSAGQYLNGLPVRNMAGAPGKPIVITGPSSNPPAKFVARATANTVTIFNSGHVEIRNLELDGNGLPVAAVRCEGNADWAHHITLENLYIHGHGVNQATVGIASFCPAWNWVIRGNTIIGAGTGIYLGNSDGSAPFVAGLIEKNMILDSIGYNMQIKHQNVRPRVEGIPINQNVTVIRKNVFSKSANSSGGKMARPNLLVGHWPISGNGSEDTYAIYGNFFYQNPTEALFQGEGNIAFYSNVLVNAFGDAINIQEHNDKPRRIDVYHNTVLATQTGIRVSGGHPGFARRLVSNAVFASVPIVGGEQHENRTGAMAEAKEHFADPFAALGSLDLSPMPGKLIVESANSRLQYFLVDMDRDFDGKIYQIPIAGAYTDKGANAPLAIEPRH